MIVCFSYFSYTATYDRGRKGWASMNVWAAKKPVANERSNSIFDNADGFVILVHLCHRVNKLRWVRQRACHKGQSPNRAKQVEEGHASKRRMEVGALLDAHVRLLAHNAGNVLIQVEEQHDWDCRHCTCQNAFWRNVAQVCGPRPSFSGGKSWRDEATNMFVSPWPSWPRVMGAGLASKMVCTGNHAWATADPVCVSLCPA